MAAMEPLCHLAGLKSSRLTKEENLILEANLFTCVCEELKEIFRKQYKDYFHLLNFTRDMENAMLEKYFVRLIINDILSTKEYTLSGIARYTNTHEDVVEEILLERNTNPSALFLRRLIELHRSIRPTLYSAIMKKIQNIL
jgi:hypothetical protein